METPALNPTGGVTVKKPADLDFKKDPTRPGGGVFILHGKGNDTLDGVIGTSEEGKDSEGEVALQLLWLRFFFFIVRTLMTLTPHFFALGIFSLLISPFISEFRHLPDHELCS